MADRPRTRRMVAAGTSRGGRTTRDTAMARPEPTSRMITMVWPSTPVWARTWPSSGLSAWGLTVARPSGNEMVFFTSEPGLSTANGPTMTTTTATATPTNRHAMRLPSRTKTIANAITRAGRAGAFIEQATPKARAAGTGLVRWFRQSSAKPRHMNATMGTSVPPTHSSNEMIGEAVSSSAQRTLSLAPAIRSATAKVARNTAPNQTLGSVSTPWPSSAWGTPNTAIKGRYGLYWLGLVVAASACALRYGVPSWMSSLAEVATTPTSGSPKPCAISQSSGNRIAPHIIAASATSTPRVCRDRQAMTASAASVYPPTAAWPHSRCRGSVLNSATPPANRAEANSPALSQAQGMVVTDCQTPGLVAPVPPSTPVVGASSRLSRLSTRHIVRSACLPHVIRADDLPSSARLSRTERYPVTDREQDPAEPVGGESPDTRLVSPRAHTPLRWAVRLAHRFSESGVLRIDAAERHNH